MAGGCIPISPNMFSSAQHPQFHHHLVAFIAIESPFKRQYPKRLNATKIRFCLSYTHVIHLHPQWKHQISRIGTINPSRVPGKRTAVSLMIEKVRDWDDSTKMPPHHVLIWSFPQISIVFIYVDICSDILNIIISWNLRYIYTYLYTYGY